METSVAKCHWQFIPADVSAFNSWSSGLIKSAEDLYSSLIFGAERDLECACGELKGVENIGKLCTKCLVIVRENAALWRRRRIGRIELKAFISHPLSPSKPIHEFPIAPIGYRCTEAGPTALGMKYESLLQTIGRFEQNSPAIGTVEFFQNIRRLDTSAIRQALRDIIGVPTGGIEAFDPALMREGTLLFEWVRSMVQLDPDIQWLVRSCGCELDVQARL